MQNAEVSNVNDFRVVSFHNSEEFDFTPDLGCMYDGRPINGKSGAPGVQAGETVSLPYHVGNRLAINLAKRVFNTSPSATVDPKGIPTGVPIWNEDLLKQKAEKYITDLYTEEKPVAQNQTDILMAKVEEYRGMVETLLNKDKPQNAPVSEEGEKVIDGNKTFQDKQEVIVELEKRNITHDKRKNKAELEKLLV